MKAVFKQSVQTTKKAVIRAMQDQGLTRPLSNNLKGGYHINCPFGYVGRGRVRVVTKYTLIKTGE